MVGEDGMIEDYRGVAKKCGNGNDYVDNSVDKTEQVVLSCILRFGLFLYCLGWCLCHGTNRMCIVLNEWRFFRMSAFGRPFVCTRQWRCRCGCGHSKTFLTERPSSFLECDKFSMSIFSIIITFVKITPVDNA